jgi:hypothetical protein
MKREVASSVLRSFAGVCGARAQSGDAIEGLQDSARLIPEPDVAWGESPITMDGLSGSSHPQGTLQLEGQNGFGRHANRTALGQNLGKRAGARP